jgi:hypothetical protein
MNASTTPQAGQPDQVQITIIIETLSELSAHPDFQAGLRDAEAQFLESHDAAPLTEDEMMEEVESNLRRSVMQQCRKVARIYGYTAPSYLYQLGFLLIRG